MGDLIYIVSEKRDNFYELSDLIAEMMDVESMQRQECIDYFMDGLEGSRYKSFVKDINRIEIVNWIVEDMGISFAESRKVKLLLLKGGR